LLFGRYSHKEFVAVCFKRIIMVIGIGGVAIIETLLLV
jgi:hypothetical protein